MRHLDPKEFKAWNEEMMREYSPEFYHHHPNPLVRYVEAKRVRWVINFLKLHEDERLMEAGCGTGNILETLRCREIIGVDLSPYLLAKAKQKNIPHLQLVNANVESLPFQDKSLGKIICSEVLEHVLDPQKLLVEVRRVLRDDGKLIISIPNEDMINFIKRTLKKLRLFYFFLPQHSKEMEDHQISDDMTPEWHLHKLNLNVLKEMLKNYFVIIKYKGIPFNFLPIRYVIQCKKK